MAENDESRAVGTTDVHAGPQRPAEGGSDAQAQAVPEHAQPRQAWFKRPGVVLGAILVAVFGFIVVGAMFPTGIGGGPAAGSKGSGGASTPEAAVQEYLEAVSAGDAETAVSYFAEMPANMEFLTDEALAASNAAAPMSDIQVGALSEGYPGAQTVSASYSLGGEPQQHDVVVMQLGSRWFVGNGATMRTEYGAEGDVPVALNGTPVESDSPNLFPGRYELSVAHDFFELEEPMTVTHASTAYRVKLSESGVAAFRSTVRAAIDECLASTQLDAGCGLAVSPTLQGGTVVAEGSVTRSLDGTQSANLDAAEITPKMGQPGAFTADLGEATVSAKCGTGAVKEQCAIADSPLAGGVGFDTPTVNLLEETPTVTWTMSL